MPAVGARSRQAAGVSTAKGSLDCDAMGSASATRYEVVEVRLGPVPEPLSPMARVDVVFTEPGGREWRVPAFASKGEWRVRYSSGTTGEHRYRVVADQDLADPTGVVYVEPGDASHPLRAHGPLQVADDHRHLEHSDGTPLLWLADTWWEGLTRRLTTEQFRELATRRVEQGFSVIQIVAGLYPEMAPFAHPRRGEHERVGLVRGLHRFEPGVVRRSRRASCRTSQSGPRAMHRRCVGLIRAADGYSKMLRHWRELIARWGAHPVVWCLAGEMPAVELKVMRAAASRLEQGNIKPADLLRVLARQISLKVRRRGRSRGFPDSEGIATLLGLGPVVADQVRNWNEVL
jgi:hypothetical protein